MGDLLKMDYINSLPQPFMARIYGGDDWPVNDIDAETGLLRLDVFGRLQGIHIGDVNYITDGDGNKHDSDTFYSDYDPKYAQANNSLPTVLNSGDENRRRNRGDNCGGNPGRPGHIRGALGYLVGHGAGCADKAPGNGHAVPMRPPITQSPH